MTDAPTFAVGDRVLVRAMRGTWTITELFIVRGEAVLVGGVDGRMVRVVPTADLLPAVKKWRMTVAADEPMDRPNLFVAMDAVADYNSVVLRRMVPELVAELQARRAAMDAALIQIKYSGDSTVKRLWRECGYDLPRKG